MSDPQRPKGCQLSQNRAVKHILAVCLLLVLIAPRAADAADGDLIERLATCQDSWFEWKDNPAQMRALANSFNDSFTQKGNTPVFAPKQRMLVAGLPVSQAYPQSVGMGVGFSLVVDANFETTRAALEKVAKKPLTMCETGDGMRSCELQVAEKRTLMLMTGDSGRAKTTLIGCYYFYEK